MQWFYARDGRQLGPIDDQELRSLFQQGLIQSDTLVWCPALPDWQPYHAVGPGADSGSPPPPPIPSAVCVECAHPFPPAQLLEYGEFAVCGACKPIFLRRIEQGTLPHLGVEYAGFAPRALAKMVDWVILALLQGALQYAVMAGRDMSDPFAVMMISMITGLIGMVAMVGYNGYFIGRFGATPGKMALGLSVVGVSGETPSYMRAFGRAAAEIVSSLTIYIGYIMVAFDPKRRALHDYIADTRVVRE